MLRYTPYREETWREAIDAALGEKRNEYEWVSSPLSWISASGHKLKYPDSAAALETTRRSAHDRLREKRREKPHLECQQLFPRYRVSRSYGQQGSCRYTLQVSLICLEPI